MYFGMRSRTEHVHVNLGQGYIDIDKETLTGDRFLELSERATKTGSIVTGDTRAFAPKMIENRGKKFDSF